jgi:CheY-like chemotaxis protein
MLVSAERQVEGRIVELLDSEAFIAQVEQELARKRRVGGFLSVCLLGTPDEGSRADASARPIDAWWPQLRPQVRTYDVLGRVDKHTLGFLMPDTALAEAVLGGVRLLKVLNASGPPMTALAAGAASAYGALEGGALALIDAAVAALQTAAPGQVAESRTTRGEPRLLVVDDDQAFATALAETISQHGWLGHPCTDPQDALERVRRNEYQGLFVDLVLPGLSGVDILREALAYYPRRPAILMSGYDADHGAVLDALALGPVMFIRKPISAPDLDAALRMFRVLLPGVRQR